MKIVMMGTGPFAVPTFLSLADAHEILCLVTRPTIQVRRGKQPPNPMRDAGQVIGLPIHEPSSVNDDDFVALLRNLQPDLLVVCDYGQILSNDCLSTARLGGINLHGSLLPKYRGAAPVHWPIYHGDPTTGVCVIHMTPKLDGGPVLSFEETPIGDDETAAELEPRLSRMGVPLVHQAIQQLENWDGESLIGQVQDPSQATPARRLKKSDGVIDWTKSASQVRNQIRAFQPWPASHSFWDRAENKTLRLIFHRVQLVNLETIDGIASAGLPGEVMLADRNQLIVATGSGLLQIDSVQPSGKKTMDIAEFLRGYPVQPGDRFHAG